MPRERDRYLEIVSSLYATDRDARRSPLRELLAVLDREAEVLRANGEELWSDAFVETGSGWAVPYLGGLIRGTLTAGAGKDSTAALAELARASVTRFEEDVRSIPPSWWPRGLAAEAFAIHWKAGADGALGDERFREATYRSLRGSWRAFRGVRVSRASFNRALRRARRHLPPLERVTIADFRADRHLASLLALFRSVESIKPTEAKWVSTSKTLYFLLPDLVPPIDNAFTVPFLRRAGVRLRPGIDREALGAAFTQLSAIARLAGKRRLRDLSGDPRYSIPVGMARVVDFAIAARASRTPSGRSPS